MWIAYSEENFIMMRLPGFKFLELAFEPAVGNIETLDGELRKIRDKYPKKRLTLIVEALKDALRERSNKFNSEYGQNVRSASGPPRFVF
jgi:hypothetical protein